VSGDNVISRKSNVTFLENGRVRKVYQPYSGQNDGVTDPILSANSSKKPESYYFRKEAGILETLTAEINRANLLPPYLHARYDSELKLEMERILGSTFRDKFVEALQEGRDVLRVVEELPYMVADIHRQMSSVSSQLLENVSWKSSSKGGCTYGLKLRSKDDERNRIWHYLRAVIYSVSPECEEFREKASSGSKRGVLNRSITAYLANKGIVQRDLTEKFVDRDFQIMYGTKNPEKDKDKLLASGKLVIVQGDLGPQHIFESGRFIDLDEARLSVGETDLVSALYSIFTSPFTDEHELRLVEASMGYLENTLGRDPNTEERAAFLSRLVEGRIKEGLRLFAADCKAPVDKLREITSGHPEYDQIPDHELRQHLLKRSFIDGLQRFLNFYARGAGRRALVNAPDSDVLYDQLRCVEDVFQKTKVFEGIGDIRVVGRLEKLLGQ
jgi:hypothetical protein